MVAWVACPKGDLPVCAAAATRPRRRRSPPQKKPPRWQGRGWRVLMRPKCSEMRGKGRGVCRRCAHWQVSTWTCHPRHPCHPAAGGRPGGARGQAERSVFPPTCFPCRSGWARRLLAAPLAAARRVRAHRFRRGLDWASPPHRRRASSRRVCRGGSPRRLLPVGSALGSVWASPPRVVGCSCRRIGLATSPPSRRVGADFSASPPDRHLAASAPRLQPGRPRIPTVFEPRRPAASKIIGQSWSPAWLQFEPVAAFSTAIRD